MGTRLTCPRSSRPRKQFDQLWADLAAEDARKAYRARNALAFAQAIPCLSDCLHPIRPVDAKRVEKLIADLDSEQFAAREAAAKELAKSSDLACIAHSFGCFRRKSAVRKDFAQTAQEHTVFRRLTICGFPANRA